MLSVAEFLDLGMQGFDLLRAKAAPSHSLQFCLGDARVPAVSGLDLLWDILDSVNVFQAAHPPGGHARMGCQAGGETLLLRGQDRFKKGYRLQSQINDSLPVDQ